MLVAERKSFLNRNYSIFDEQGAEILLLNVKGLAMTAHFELEGNEYTFKSQGVFSKEYEMLENGNQVGSAELMSRFSSDYNINLAGRKLSLTKAGIFDQTFDVLFHSYRQGSVFKESTFSSKIIINLASDWPLPFRLFVFWLVMYQWAQTESAA